MKKENVYEDILFLEHPASKTHRKMSRLERAAQFQPFSALTGYEEAIAETARLTEKRIELDENSKQLLDERLQLLQKNIQKKLQISITYFKQDERKEGGVYLTSTGCVKKIDSNLQCLIYMDGQEIPIRDIFSIEGTLFSNIENEYA